MEITRHTFNEQLDNILSAIKESTFLAVDGEFTGLDISDGGHTAPFDTPAERYSKIRNGCSDFLLIQFGLCAFKVDEEKQQYTARPYNFYLFPKPHNRHAPDRRFLCQSSSIDFLITQGFDFNKLFKEGIPYLSPDQEMKLKAELDRKHEEANRLSSPGLVSPESAKKTAITIPEEQKPFLNSICEQVTKYLEADEETEPLALPSCNAFQRKLIYQTVEEKFPLAHVETKTGEKGSRFMVVTKTKDAEERQKKELEKQNMEKMELDLQVGFTKVIKAITESGKLVVGHNMFLDIIHVVNHFACPLPPDVEDFKTVVRSVFPRILDTKLMAGTQPFKEHMLHTSLEEVQLTLQHPPFTPVKIETAEGFDAYEAGNGAMHEAGYDAYITGCCFATMTKFLGSFQKPPVEFLLPTAPVVEPFVNKLFLMRIYDIPYLNLAGPDLQVNRDHIFHVTFPREWKPSDMFSLFQPYGNIQISWLTETTAYVALHNKENAKMAHKALSQEEGSFHVMSYAAHHLTKSCKWSAVTPVISSPSAPGYKRKLQSPSADCPPPKVKRHSLTHEPQYPVIPEENENVEMEGSPNKSQENNHQKTPTDLSVSGTGREDKGETVPNKLFEETDTWG